MRRVELRYVEVRVERDENIGNVRLHAATQTIALQ